MNKLIYIISIFVAFTFLACNKYGGVGTNGKDFSWVEINFDLAYGDQDFEINKVYDYLDYQVKFEKMLLYVSNLYVVNEDGKIIHGKEIYLIDASADHNRLAFVVPPGVYSKIGFYIGVPIELNGTDSVLNPDFDASLYSPNHPLSLSNGMYWTWNSGYRFILMDGRTNTDPMVDDVFETLLSIHTGKDYSFRGTEASIDLAAPIKKGGKLNFTFDIESFLNHPDDVIDIAIDNQSHGTNASLANRLSDNAIKSVEIK
ncbi:MAG: hypothetical protein DRI54_03340 [Bacteroidetes bacterium]|nr:MAG: hypothetical protein DRI54_03340 [Bacteroidota bacterium]